MAEPAAPVRRPLWDGPIRIFHWVLVALFAGMWWTAENHDLERHVTLGLITLALVVFRVLWGVVGSPTGRFANFVKGPRAIADYLAGRLPEAVGHNPIGGLSVIAMLGLLVAQLGLGLIAQDVDGLESGPLNHLVSYETADAAREWHELGFNLLLVLAAIHVAAILWYLLVRRKNLVGPMITGGELPEGAPVQARGTFWTAFVICAAIAAGIAYWIGLGAPLAQGT